MSRPPSVQIHPQALVESSAIGAGTRVWAFAHVLPGARIGRDCNICDGVFIENDVVVGDRVTVKCGVQLWDGVRLGDDVFVGPNATFTNDPLPRSRQHPATFATTVVGAGASIGANATILPGLTIGAGAMIGAGAVVTGSVPPHAKVIGNPGRIIGYMDTPRVAAARGAETDHNAGVDSSGVGGARLIHLPRFEDLRGRLTVGEIPRDLPFVPQRIFIVHDVPSREVRGEHAHRRCQQLLICVAGQMSVMVDDGKQREEYRLDAPHLALYLPPRVWGSQFGHSADATLVVLASEPYDADDYIRDYAAFLAEIGGG
jgi:UDP-2-acetamido-3-amino-2,3-dideoxy-glucuronate N-acetyltransferase